jgi:hypothetical protein
MFIALIGVFLSAVSSVVLFYNDQSWSGSVFCLIGALSLYFLQKSITKSTPIS